MCRSSLIRQECFNENCGSYHIKGTRRKKIQQQGDKKRIPASSAKDKHVNENGTADFLDMLKTLKQEILQAMDLKIQMAQIKPQPPQQMSGIPFPFGGQIPARGYPPLLC